MPKTTKSIFSRHMARVSATPLRSRIKKAAMYAGLVWFVLLVGVVLLKYCFGVIDRPMAKVLAESAILPLLLFGVFLYGYRITDQTKHLYDATIQENEKA